MKIAYDKFELTLSKNNLDFFKHHITLSNDKVELEPLRIEDKSAFCTFLIDDTIWKYFAIRMCHEQDMNKYIDDAVNQRHLGLRYHFTIKDKEKKKIVGSTAFGNYSQKDNRIEIGWSWLDTISQGSGVNKSAKFLLIDFAFKYLNAERVEFKTDILNTRARAALIKIGATEEGVLRSHTLMPDGRRRDTIYYSVLRDEWEKEIKPRIFLDYNSNINASIGLSENQTNL